MSSADVLEDQWKALWEMECLQSAYTALVDIKGSFAWGQEEVYGS